MPTTPTRFEDLRGYLTEQKLTHELLKDFIERALDAERERLRDEDASSYLRMLSETIKTFYPQAVDTIYKYAESEIEKIFLNSVVMLFLKNDPLALQITAPCDDALKDIKERQRWLAHIFDAVNEIEEGTKGKKDLRHYLDFQVKEGELTEEQAEDIHSTYITHHFLQLKRAFHFMMQAPFPTLKVDGKSIRADIVVWVPNKPDFRLVVECDGYEYHSGKESFTKDRKRDRLFQSHGFNIFRFSGSEIWKNPTEAPSELYDYLYDAVEDMETAIP